MKSNEDLAAASRSFDLRSFQLGRSTRTAIHQQEPGTP